MIRLDKERMSIATKVMKACRKFFLNLFSLKSVNTGSDPAGLGSAPQLSVYKKSGFCCTAVVLSPLFQLFISTTVVGKEIFSSHQLQK